MIMVRSVCVSAGGNNDRRSKSDQETNVHSSDVGEQPLGRLNFFAHFNYILEVLIGLCENRAGTGGAVHFAYVAFADHCVEDGGGTAVADA